MYEIFNKSRLLKIKIKNRNSIYSKKEKFSPFLAFSKLYKKLQFIKQFLFLTGKTLLNINPIQEDILIKSKKN